MSKQEEVYSINDELIDQEVQAPVKSNKIKYIIAIITGVIIAAAVAVLLLVILNSDGSKAKLIKLMPTFLELITKPIISMNKKI